MARLIPAAERITRAQVLIQKTRDLSLTTESDWQDFAYIAQVKDMLRQARDLVKFIPYSPSATAEIKKDVAAVFAAADAAEKELLHR
jgi:hypothetical protein